MRDCVYKTLWVSIIYHLFYPVCLSKKLGIITFYLLKCGNNVTSLFHGHLTNKEKNKEH